MHGCQRLTLDVFLILSHFMRQGPLLNLALAVRTEQLVTTEIGEICWSASPRDPAVFVSQELGL